MADPTAPQTFIESIVRNQLMFDVGANVGKMTRGYLENGAAMVIAVEPQPACCAQLRETFKLEPRFHLIEAAASNELGRMTLTPCETAPILASPVPGKWARRFPGYVWRGALEVTAVTLDSLIMQFGVPGFIKVDVEGYEPQVFQGLSVPVRAVCWERATENIKDTWRVAERLMAVGSYRFNYPVGAEARMRFNHWRRSTISWTPCPKMAPQIRNSGQTFTR